MISPGHTPLQQGFASRVVTRRKRRSVVLHLHEGSRTRSFGDSNTASHGRLLPFGRELGMAFLHPGLVRPSGPYRSLSALGMPDLLAGALPAAGGSRLFPAMLTSFPSTPSCASPRRTQKLIGGTRRNRTDRACASPTHDAGPSEAKGFEPNLHTLHELDQPRTSKPESDSWP